MEAVARTSAAPGSAFIDRMIALVEGAERRKTPNELALSILLSGLTIVFPIVCATLWPLARYSGATLSLTVRIALLVCLIPTTIGGLLSASCGSAHDRIERVVDGPLRRTARRGRTGRTARQNHRRRLAPGPAPRRPDRTHFRKRSRWRNAPLCAARKHDADRPGAITRRMAPADARQIALGRDRPALDGYRGPRRNGKSIQACGQSSSTTGVGVWMDTAAAATSVAIAAGLAHIFEIWLGLPAPSLSLVFLVPVAFCAVSFGLWTAIAASVISIFATEPRLQFAITQAQEFLSLLVFLVVAIITGTLAARVREQSQNMRTRAQSAQSLLEFSRKISGAASLDDILWISAIHAQGTLGARCVLPLLPRDGASCAFAQHGRRSTGSTSRKSAPLAGRSKRLSQRDGESARCPMCAFPISSVCNLAGRRRRRRLRVQVFAGAAPGGRRAVAHVDSPTNRDRHRSLPSRRRGRQRGSSRRKQKAAHDASLVALALSSDAARIEHGRGAESRRSATRRMLSHAFPHSRTAAQRDGGVSGVRVLIVDDEAQILRVLRPALTACGYDLLEAESGRDALGMIAAAAPDVVLLDLGLSDKDGNAVLREARCSSKIPMFILSARDREAEKASRRHAISARLH